MSLIFEAGLPFDDHDVGLLANRDRADAGIFLLRIAGPTAISAPSAVSEPAHAET